MKVIKFVLAVIFLATAGLMVITFNDSKLDGEDVLVSYSSTPKVFNSRVSSITDVLDVSTAPAGLSTGINTSLSDPNVDKIIHMSGEEMWNLLRCGLADGTDYNWAVGSNSYGRAISTVQSLYANHSVTIEVPVWQWKNPSTGSWQSTDLEKVSGTMKFTVHEKLQDVFAGVFEEVYNLPEKPVIYNCGAWVIKSKTNSTTGSLSAHAYGASIDLNHDASAGGFSNGYGARACRTMAEWKSMPEVQGKYMVFCEEGDVVQTFYKWGFYWGGVWNTSDAMHFGLFGDSVSGQRGRDWAVEKHKSIVGD